MVLNPEPIQEATLVRTAIDAGVCTGHGRCYGLSPGVYDADEEGHGVVVTPDVPPQLQELARQAAADCPERAVHVVD